MVGVAVDLPGANEARQERFARYVEALANCLRHKDRIEPFQRYCVGLLIPGERKSVEPMAARLNPERTAAEHQSLLHFVGQAPWDADLLLQAVRAEVLPLMTQREPLASWIIDDTGFPKQGQHSVGVGRQYCGELGKQENCQIAVSLSVATRQASLPIAWRLYLPEVWANDPDRRRVAKVPAEVTFQTKPEIALAQIRAALAQGVPTGVVLADAGYGHSSGFRDQLAQLALDYIVGVQGTLSIWPPDMTPVRKEAGRGPRPTRVRRGGDDAPVVKVRDLAVELPAKSWQTVRWREGVAQPLSSRFAAVRVRPAQGDNRRSEPRPWHWLLIEWPADKAEPTKFWLSNLPAETALRDLVYHAKQRWLIERDYQELKQELGLGHFEGRGWRGFHHHAALCVAAYGFLVAERAAFPPSGPARARRSPTAPVPESSPRRTATAPA